MSALKLRIATAPITSDQARPKPTASTRLCLAACPMPANNTAI